MLLAFHSAESGKLLPIRIATVIAAEEFGAIVFLRFRVGAFVHPTETLIKCSATPSESDRANAEKEFATLENIDTFLAECSSEAGANTLCNRLSDVIKLH